MKMSEKLDAVEKQKLEIQRELLDKLHKLKEKYPPKYVDKVMEELIEEVKK